VACPEDSPVWLCAPDPAHEFLLFHSKPFYHQASSLVIGFCLTGDVPGGMVLIRTSFRGSP
jgi:hypothetical protein